MLEEKTLYQKHDSYRYTLPLKNWVDWISTRRDKNRSLKNKHFEKDPKAKKEKKILMTTFYNFALIIETGWAVGMVKPILKTGNLNDDLY